MIISIMILEPLQDLSLTIFDLTSSKAMDGVFLPTCNLVIHAECLTDQA